LQRLVIALTALFTMTGAVVVLGYLLIFAASPDRAARAVPAGAAFYATVHLQPSTGQKLNLASLLGHVPGFADASSLDQKLHEIAGRLLGEVGFDYEADIRPWLGDRLSLAVRAPSAEAADAADVAALVLVEVKDRPAAEAALEQIAAERKISVTHGTYKGTPVSAAGDTSWALLDDLLIVAPDGETLHAALDADADRAPSLADEAAFGTAMRRVPADHLASVYLDLEAAAQGVGATDEVGGYSTATLALVVEPDGLRLAGSAPFDASAAPSDGRGAFALSSEPSSLAEWMPSDTQAEAVVFGLAQALRAVEAGIGAQDGMGDIADAVNQLRALAALGLGISVDDDVLPLLDREVGVAVSGFEGTTPSISVLLRPSDADAAEAAIGRMSDALAEHGATVTQHSAGSGTITTVAIPDLGEASFTLLDGVVVIGLEADDVMAALAARESGETLAASDRYRAAWDLAGIRGGNEAYLDVASIEALLAEQLGLTGDARDILHAIGAIGMTAPARDAQTEIHVVVTLR
jgi:hypothetical protein